MMTRGINCLFISDLPNCNERSLLLLTFHVLRETETRLRVIGSRVIWPITASRWIRTAYCGSGEFRRRIVCAAPNDFQVFVAGGRINLTARIFLEFRCGPFPRVARHIEQAERTRAFL